MSEADRKPVLLRCDECRYERPDVKPDPQTGLNVCNSCWAKERPPESQRRRF